VSVEAVGRPVGVLLVHEGVSCHFGDHGSSSDAGVLTVSSHHTAVREGEREGVLPIDEERRGCRVRLEFGEGGVHGALRSTEDASGIDVCGAHPTEAVGRMCTQPGCGLLKLSSRQLLAVRQEDLGAR
jgi:hypothetical protein